MSVGLELWGTHPRMAILVTAKVAVAQQYDHWLEGAVAQQYDHWLVQWPSSMIIG